MRKWVCETRGTVKEAASSEVVFRRRTIARAEDRSWKRRSGDRMVFYTRIPSKRKPYNLDAGYIASLRSGKGRGGVVIYNAKKQGIDDADGKYAVVCQTHHSIVNATSLPKARGAMKFPESFCEGCRGDA